MSKKFQTPFCETCQARFGSIFCNLSEDELVNVSIQKHCNFYLKGQQIFTEGNSPTGLHCVNKGKIKVSQSGFEGKEQIIRLAKEGDILGYRSLISGEAYTASAIAIEDSKVCIIPKNLFFEMIQKNPDITGRIMKLLASDLKDAENKITNLAQKPVIERLAEAILMLKEYYGFVRDENSLNITITREEIANIVGTATETAIRILSELKREGIIALDGKKIKILNIDALIKLANLYD